MRSSPEKGCRLCDCQGMLATAHATYHCMQEFADTNAIPFFETSAKGNHNVETAFLQLTREIQARVAQNSKMDPKNNKPTKPISLKGVNIDNKQKDGCGC